MPLPIALTVVYLAVNLALLYWLERERAEGRPPAPRVAGLSLALRFGPPLVGLGYLVTIAGDWLFFVVVIAFFGSAFWLMDGALGYTTPANGTEAMRSGWDDRGSNTERERS